MFRVLLIVAILLSPVAWAESLKLMTAKDPKEWVSVLQAFTAQTGVPVDVVVGTHDELMKRIDAGESADLFLTKDLVFLHDAVEREIYQPVQSAEIQRNSLSLMRHPDNLWVGLTYRARVIMYHPDRVAVDELQSYEGLTDAKWSKRLCLRVSANSYNQGLVAGFLAFFGEEWTQRTLRSWLGNLAIEPLKGDTLVLEAIAEGRCDLGVTNTYYLAGLIKKNPTFKVRPFFPSAATSGAMTNGAGIGVLKTSRQPDMARRLIEHLLTIESQEAIVATSNEYPVNPGAQPTEIVKGFGNFQLNGVSWAEAGKSVARAKTLMSEVGWP